MGVLTISTRLPLFTDRVRVKSVHEHIIYIQYMCVLSWLCCLIDFVITSSLIVAKQPIRVHSIAHVYHC